MSGKPQPRKLTRGINLPNRDARHFYWWLISIPIWFSIIMLFFCWEWLAWCASGKSQPGNWFDSRNKYELAKEGRLCTFISTVNFYSSVRFFIVCFLLWGSDSCAVYLENLIQEFKAREDEKYLCFKGSFLFLCIIFCGDFLLLWVWRRGVSGVACGSWWTDPAGTYSNWSLERELQFWSLWQQARAMLVCVESWNGRVTALE